MTYTINYRKFRTETSNAYIVKNLDVADDDFFNVWDDPKWSTYLYYIESVYRDGACIYFPHSRRYSHEEDKSINKIEEYRI